MRRLPICSDQQRRHREAVGRLHFDGRNPEERESTDHGKSISCPVEWDPRERSVFSNKTPFIRSQDSTSNTPGESCNIRVRVVGHRARGWRMRRGIAPANFARCHGLGPSGSAAELVRRRHRRSSWSAPARPGASFLRLTRRHRTRQKIRQHSGAWSTTPSHGQPYRLAIVACRSGSHPSLGGKALVYGGPHSQPPILNRMSSLAQ